MYISSLHIDFKGIIHLSQWRKLVSDGVGFTRGKNTGHTPNTRGSGGLKKKPLELDYFEVSREVISHVSHMSFHKSSHMSSHKSSHMSFHKPTRMSFHKSSHMSTYK